MPSLAVLHSPPSLALELRRFPVALRRQIAMALRAGGRIDPDLVRILKSELKLETGELMIRLLGLAGRFAAASISGFRVGAVARGNLAPDGESALYFGANIEFHRQSLGFVVHAEQAAISQAWLAGESGVNTLAVSAWPCGCCRQFLQELTQAANLQILVPGAGRGTVEQFALPMLLPRAFGPGDLGKANTFMDPSAPAPSLSLVAARDDPLARMALDAAAASYAPYTGGHAGCALQTADGRMFGGRSLESAACTPSLLAVASALVALRFGGNTERAARVTRAVFVEVPSAASQVDATRAIVDSFAPRAAFEALTARVVRRATPERHGRR